MSGYAQNGRAFADMPVDRRMFDALAIIARHVVPVVTPEPDAEVRDVLAEACLDEAWYHSDGECWVDPSRIPEGDDPEDWTPELVQWEQANDEFRKNGYRMANAGLAALRARGFAVVRTADVGGLCPPSVIAWFVKHGYDFESMRESLRAFPDDPEYMDELSDALVAAEHWVADDEVYARLKEAIQ